MAILDILVRPHPVLKKKAKPVKKITPEIRKLVRNMIDTLTGVPGRIGLAANQVGVSIQVIVVDIHDEAGAQVFINPKITHRSKNEVEVMEEGCLSLPGIEAPVERPANIVVKWQDLKGNLLESNASGLLARVIQHEVDHLNGILFIERVKDLALIRYKALENPEEIL